MEIDKILFGVSRPGRYTGGEWNSITKDWTSNPIKIALAYPDAYEIGMSNMAIPILYELLNAQPDVLCERTYAPWTDMEAAMRAAGIPLFSLESQQPLKKFDIIGFSLGYELTYTNVLNMLDLAHLPVLAEERDDSCPLVIAGGSSAINPEPMSDFIDLFIIGEAEEVIAEFLECFRRWRKHSRSKSELLREALTINGVYIPGFYRADYQSDGCLFSFGPTMSSAPTSIQRRIVTELPPPPVKPVVPYIEVVHDRASIEIQRGCARGCRFCQAGMIYRPLRERPPEEVVKAVGEILKNTGYHEVSLVSLSTSDYPDIVALVNNLFRTYNSDSLTLSLPSLRLDGFPRDLLKALSRQKKVGLTFAPEAGSERLCRAINKPISFDDMLNTVATAFGQGWLSLKLYFMVGLPTENTKDVEEIINLVKQVSRQGRQSASRLPRIKVSVSPFIPKPHTPFQWAAQNTTAELDAKRQALQAGIKGKGIQFSWQDPQVSLLEAVISRGDRRLGRVIKEAWRSGCTFDAWSERFQWPKWLEAFDRCGLSPAFYAQRQRDMDELLPWSHIDLGVSPEFLKREYQYTFDEKLTPDCRPGSCNACGLQEHPLCQGKFAGTKE